MKVCQTFRLEAAIFLTASYSGTLFSKQLRNFIQNLKFTNNLDFSPVKEINITYFY